MKTRSFISVPHLSVQVFFLAALSVLLLSCSAEDLPADADLSATAVETSVAAAAKKAAPAPGEESIAAIAIAGGFDELVKALTYVDESLHTQLVDLFLNGKDQYTVFAPTNEAFEQLYTNLGINTIEEAPADLVLDVLLYHVVEGRRAANSVVPPKNDRNIETLLGVGFKVDATGKITALGNTAQITSPNLSASNGIIHVIDAVLLPLE